MSMELHVFLKRENVPDAARWQAAIDALELPVKIDAQWKPSNTGFSPGTVGGVDAGCEIYFDEASELLETDSHLQERVGDREVAISFRWGGNLAECAFAEGAAAGLVSAFDGVAYDPQDSEVCELADLKNGCGESMAHDEREKAKAARRAANDAAYAARKRVEAGEPRQAESVWRRIWRGIVGR